MMFKASILAALFALTEASVDYIAGFRPETSVTDHNAIDLDQEYINILMGSPTEDTFQDAAAMYEFGAHSKSIAKLYLNADTSLPGSITEDLAVTGVSVDGKALTGTVYKVPTGEVIPDKGILLEVQYDTSSVQANYMNCKVGGHATPIIDGCFKANGTIALGNLFGDREYSYDPSTDNYNARTIKGFSTGAESRMKPADGSTNVVVGAGGWFVHFQKFVDYYGTPFYGDDFVVAALSGLRTNFNNGNVDFRNEAYQSRSQSVKKGTNYMIIAMYVIRELEDAIDDCFRDYDKDEGNDDAVHALDEAVAFYTGSLEGTAFTKSSEGVLMYNLADKRCSNFNSCGEDSNTDSTVSYVNRRVFDLFQSMQRNLLAYDCVAAIPIKDRIVEYMTVPLIQGTLKYAYIKAYNDASDEDALEGNVFAQSVLPYIHYCDEDAAKTIYEEMEGGKLDADYFAVKNAFESVYDCLGVTCSDVGGQWDGTEYLTDAEPCSDAYGIPSSFGFVVLAVSFILSMTM